jgi:glycosyltransferase involved in cell wall biosynthesis
MRFPYKFFFFFVFIIGSIYAHEPDFLVVNIISHSLTNGAGKQVDVAILKKELEQLGHHVNLFDYYKVANITSADINIFLAQFKMEWFSKAKLNWLIPNAEYCNATLSELQAFDLILCKTKECLRIFKSMCDNVYYLGFTSRDCYEPRVAKDFSKHLHLAGKSRMKGTAQVLQAWRKHPELPLLTLIKHRETPHFFPFKNLRLIKKRISNRSLIKLQNQCGVHVCPSKTEGFGHYIMEAMSTGAVVITTDAPPMNEFIWNTSCLVKYNHTGERKYATTYIIGHEELAQTVKELQDLSFEELKKMGEQNRAEFLRRTKEFKHNFKKLMERTMTQFNG